MNVATIDKTLFVSNKFSMNAGVTSQMTSTKFVENGKMIRGNIFQDLFNSPEHIIYFQGLNDTINFIYSKKIRESLNNYIWVVSKYDKNYKIGISLFSDSKHAPESLTLHIFIKAKDLDSSKIFYKILDEIVSLDSYTSLIDLDYRIVNV